SWCALLGGMLAITLSGSSAFTTTADGCSTISLGPKKSCAVTVTYTPGATGEAEATLAASAKKPPANAALALTDTWVPRHLYWANSCSGTIGRADLDGQSGDERASSREETRLMGSRSTRLTSTGRTSTAKRSGAPTSTASTSTRASSPSR